MAISVSIYGKSDNERGESRICSYICDSFNVSAGGKIVIHFGDGDIVVGPGHHDGVVAYPHNNVETSVFNGSIS